MMKKFDQDFKNNPNIKWNFIKYFYIFLTIYGIIYTMKF